MATRPLTRRALLIAAVLAMSAGLLLACGSSGRSLRDPKPGATAPPRKESAAGTLTPSSGGSEGVFGLASTAWTPGGEIPKKFTCDGDRHLSSDRRVRSTRGHRRGGPGRHRHRRTVRSLGHGRARPDLDGVRRGPSPARSRAGEQLGRRGAVHRAVPAGRRRAHLRLHRLRLAGPIRRDGGPGPGERGRRHHPAADTDGQHHRVLRTLTAPAGRIGTASTAHHHLPWRRDRPRHRRGRAVPARRHLRGRVQPFRAATPVHRQRMVQRRDRAATPLRPHPQPGRDGQGLRVAREQRRSRP